MNHLALSYLKLVAYAIGVACAVTILLAVLFSERATGADVIMALGAFLVCRQLVRDLKRTWRNRFVIRGGRP